jgi:hypothetical protein
MTRILSLAMFAAVLGLSSDPMGLVATAAPLEINASPPALSAASVTCAAIEGTVLTALSDRLRPAPGGCCQRLGGVCGCRRGRLTCCDGSAMACPCHVDSPGPDTDTAEP